MKPLRVVSLLTLTILIEACATAPLPDTSQKKDKACARQCTVAYSNCVSTALELGQRRACWAGLEMCLGTCD
jgi:hypothetical protein